MLQLQLQHTSPSGHMRQPHWILFGGSTSGTGSSTNAASSGSSASSSAAASSNGSTIGDSASSYAAITLPASISRNPGAAPSKAASGRSGRAIPASSTAVTFGAGRSERRRRATSSVDRSSRTSKTTTSDAATMPTMAKPTYVVLMAHHPSLLLVEQELDRACAHLDRGS